MTETAGAYEAQVRDEALERAEAVAARLRQAARDLHERPWRLAAVLDEVIEYALAVQAREAKR